MSNNNLVPQRTPVLPQQLQQMVAGKIAEYFSTAEPFTAYLVTLSLRVENPTLEIEHDMVRAAVTDEMSTGKHASLPCSIGVEDWGGEQATTYRPTFPVVSGYVSPITRLAPPPPAVIPAKVGWPSINWPDDTEEAAQPPATDSE